MSNQKVYFSLLQLNKSIKRLIEGINKNFWITAEISQIQFRKHAYIELVQKENESVVASNRANIWENRLLHFEEKYGDALETLLKIGNKILVEVAVSYHEVYGISLTVIDIEASYTVGELELQRLENLKKLEEAGKLEKQPSLSLPIVVQHIAILSSPSAAGFSDFMHQLENNDFGYHFNTQLYSVKVQGAEAHKTIINGIKKIEEENKYDAIVLIRGGGSRLDLEVFNEFELALAIANCSVPVLTGIGHQRDVTIADDVAHKALKTPTAVAEFLIDCAERYESVLLDTARQIKKSVFDLLSEKEYQLNEIENTFRYLTQSRIEHYKQELNTIGLKFKYLISQYIQHNHYKLESLENAIQSYSAERMEKAGFFRIEHQGQTLKPNTHLKVGEELVLHKNKEQVMLKVEKGNKV